MDGHNRFETPTTFALARLEWLAALIASVTMAVVHLSAIRWVVFVSLFLVIDLVGYLPGAVAFRRSADGTISRRYYVAYNTMHSLLAGAAIVGLWAWLVRPEWALLAVPIHLFGDRALFGNTLKPFAVRFEPATHPAFADFERAYRGAARATTPSPRPDRPGTGHEFARNG
ncbi:MAG: rane protein [Mycobacterium sp.]|nr:rane protein [Mycobacterium sp.]